MDIAGGLEVSADHVQRLSDGIRGAHVVVFLTEDVTYFGGFLSHMFQAPSTNEDQGRGEGKNSRARCDTGEDETAERMSEPIARVRRRGMIVPR
eukprot:1922730-Rhodomonas_salina.1